ncbi:MAG: hypothetical protein ONB13_04170, partial [candidate division KSB1 bacterium]|nr:hypothetical protein [candidate division KSB1 bacterium]
CNNSHRSRLPGFRISWQDGQTNKQPSAILSMGISLLDNDRRYYRWRRRRVLLSRLSDGKIEQDEACMARYNHKPGFGFLGCVSFHATAYLCDVHYFRNGLLAHKKAIPCNLGTYFNQCHWGDFYDVFIKRLLVKLHLCLWIHLDALSPPKIIQKFLIKSLNTGFPYYEIDFRCEQNNLKSEFDDKKFIADQIKNWRRSK